MTSAERLSSISSVLFMAAFAGGWWFGGIYIATALLMGLFTLQLLAFKILRHPIPMPMLIGWGLVVVLGGLTLLLRDKTYIQLKTTVVYALFGTVLLVADFIVGKNLPRMALTSIFDAPKAIWRRVSTMLAMYFYLLAGCNLLVARYLSEGAWVGIKTFGFPTATLIFTIIIGFSLLRYAKPDKS